MVPETVSAALKYVAPLKKGKTVAYETKPREDVPDEVVDQLVHIGPAVALRTWALDRRLLQSQHNTYVNSLRCRRECFMHF
jgi:hypothetical protein